jgi:hypothetical protein
MVEIYSFLFCTLAILNSKDNGEDCSHDDHRPKEHEQLQVSLSLSFGVTKYGKTPQIVVIELKEGGR